MARSDSTSFRGRSEQKMVGRPCITAASFHAKAPEPAAPKKSGRSCIDPHATWAWCAFR